MADDGATSVALPEVPLLAVLPGTGGLTRLVDKRRVRRDRADFFCTTEEGVRGARAVEWQLVDEVVPRTALAETARRKAAEFVGVSSRPAGAQGVALTPLDRRIDGDRIAYDYVVVEVDRARGLAKITIDGPQEPAPSSANETVSRGDRFWPLKVARELDDAILHLRFNETAIGSWVFLNRGESRAV